MKSIRFVSTTSGDRGASPVGPEQGRRSGRVGRAVAPVILLALAMAFTGCSRGARDFRALQDSVVKESGCGWDREFRISVAPCLFGLARAGLSVVDLEPEVRAALETVRGVRIAISNSPGNR